MSCLLLTRWKDERQGVAWIMKVEENSEFYHLNINLLNQCYFLVT